MDKSRMQNARWSEEYREGVERFLDFAFENASEDGRILCPCLRSPSTDPPTFPGTQDDIERLLREAFNMEQFTHHSSPESSDVDESNIPRINE
ncbi:hypothetical protein PTKIN_Ptkin08bG0015800 [Pterospermum kingtungense]